MAVRYCQHCLTTFTEDLGACPNLACGTHRPDDGWEPVLAEGDLLDRHYRILRALAVGGAGLTYLAREIDVAGAPIPPDLAVKVLYSARDSGPFLRRLATEAQILQELAHDHIVECRGFVHRTGHPPYLVTLFEHGGSLGQHVERVGPLAPPVAAGILEQILAALEVAHQRDVVHRDLKPDNVLLGARVLASEVPWVRVADFGIAKVFGGVGSRVTRLGAFIGTPEYAAPEQFEGLSPTPATDVWAAGALLHHMLTGRPPFAFPHRTDLESAHAHLLATTPPALPPGIANEATQRSVQAALEHTMRVQPGDRWSIGELRAHLAPIRAAEPPRRPEPPSPQGEPPPRAAASPHAPPPPRPAPPATRPKASTKSTAPPTELIQTERSPMPDATPPRRSGAGAALGVVGLGAVVLVGGALSAVALALGAWAFGYFDGPPPAGETVLLDPITVASPEPVPATGDELRELETRLRTSAADLAHLCRPTRDVPVRLVVSPDGTVQSASVDPRVLAVEPAAACVEHALGQVTLPRTSRGRVLVEVTLPFGA